MFDGMYVYPPRVDECAYLIRVLAYLDLILAYLGLVSPTWILAKKVFAYLGTPRLLGLCSKSCGSSLVFPATVTRRSVA